MRIVARGKGRVRVLDTTALDYGSAILIAADYLSAVELEKNGLLLERCAYISTDDGRKMVKPEPIEIMSPDELKEWEAVEVDGMTFIEVIEGRLRPVLLDQIYDEDGQLDPPAAAGMRIYYKSGSYEAIATTALSYQDGHILMDDLIDFTDPERGVAWDRGVWTTTDTMLMSLRPEPSIVVDPETLGAVDVMTVEGEVVYAGEPGEPEEAIEEGGFDSD